MTLRTFRDFSVERQGYVDNEGEYDSCRMEGERLRTYFLSGASYVFDYSKRIEEAKSLIELDKVEANVFSPKSLIYRIISSSEKAQTATGVEVKDTGKKKTLCDKIAQAEVKRSEREAWEICQGWRK